MSKGQQLSKDERMAIWERTLHPKCGQAVVLKSSTYLWQMLPEGQSMFVAAVVRAVDGWHVGLDREVWGKTRISCRNVRLICRSEDEALEAASKMNAVQREAAAAINELICAGNKRLSDMGLSFDRVRATPADGGRK